MRAAYRVRLVANLVNGSTLAGLLVAAAGRARLARAADGLLVGVRYRLPVPVAPAFTVGNVILARGDRTALASMEAAARPRGAARYPVRVVRRTGHAAAVLPRRRGVLGTDR